MNLVLWETQNTQKYNLHHTYCVSLANYDFEVFKIEYLVFKMITESKGDFID